MFEPSPDNPISRLIRGRTGITHRKRIVLGLVFVAFTTPFLYERVTDPAGFNATDWWRGMDPNIVFGLFALCFLIGIWGIAFGVLRTVQGRGGELVRSDPDSGPVEPQGPDL